MRRRVRLREGLEQEVERRGGNPDARVFDRKIQNSRAGRGNPFPAPLARRQRRARPWGK